MPITSNSKAFLRIGDYIYPTTDMYAQETPFSKLSGAFNPVAMGTRHRFGNKYVKWEDIHVDAGGGGTSAYPIGG